MASSGSRVVVITGASAGIGAALARILAARGDALVLAARRRAELERLAAELESDVLTVPTDVTRRADVERLRDAALERFGRVNVWVNNAGRGVSKRVLDLQDDDIDEMIAVNLKSVIYGMQAIVPHFMERNSGHLINISSFLGRVPLATPRSIYSAMKAAVNTLTANLRMDLQQSHPGIHVSLVMPGIVATDFHRNALGGEFERPPGGASMPVQTAEEVAAIIAGVIDQPAAEIYTNPASRPLMRKYYEDVGAFERNLAPQR